MNSIEFFFLGILNLMLAFLLNFVTSDQTTKHIKVSCFGDGIYSIDSNTSVIDFPEEELISFFDGDLSSANFTVIKGNVTERYRGKDFKNLVGFFTKKGEEVKLIIERNTSSPLTLYYCSSAYYTFYDLYVSSIPNKSVRFFKDLTYKKRTNILLCNKCEYKYPSNERVPTFDDERRFGVIMPYYGNKTHSKIIVTTYVPFGIPFSGEFKGSKTSRFLISDDFTESVFYWTLLNYFASAFCFYSVFYSCCCKKEESDPFETMDYSGESIIDFD